MENLIILCATCHQMIHDGKLSVEILVDSDGGNRPHVKFWRKD
jgi:predicted HNH restriction endonuclease